MSHWIILCNNIAVSIFGSLLAASFCGALDTRRNRWVFWCSTALLLFLQGWIYTIWDDAFLRQIYPLSVHFPLLLLLSLLTRRFLWPLISIFSAYLCCQLRRWIALFVTAIFQGGPVMQDSIELLVTLPLLLPLLHWVSPVFLQLSAYPARVQCQLGLLPALYYGFDYLTVVYTDLLTSGAPVAVEFMPFVCCLAYLIFLLSSSVSEEKRRQLQQVQKSLDLQLKQSVREIEALRESQTLTQKYRHDLRHHLQYLSVCLENGQAQQAQTYISGICEEIEAQRVRRYCENEAVNLILSSFAGRAAKHGIPMNIQGGLPAVLPVSDQDLCVILSNALENALHACQPLAAAGKDCTIDLQFYERAGKCFLQVTNPCGDDIPFERGLPVSRQPGHGIGVQSICAIVERHGGIYTFLVQEGRFILRLSL